MSTSANNQQKSPFFKLPPELRNRIYSLAFSSPTNKDGSIDLKHAYPPPKDILMTCQRIYNECRGIQKTAYREYSDRVFVIDVKGRESLNRPPGFLCRRFLSQITNIRALQLFAVYDARTPKVVYVGCFNVDLSRTRSSLVAWEATVSIQGSYPSKILEAEQRRARIQARTEAELMRAKQRYSDPHWAAKGFSAVEVAYAALRGVS